MNKLAECPKCKFENPVARGTMVPGNEGARPPIPPRFLFHCLVCGVPFYVVESTQG